MSSHGRRAIVTFLFAHVLQACESPPASGPGPQEPSPPAVLSLHRDSTGYSFFRFNSATGANILSTGRPEITSTYQGQGAYDPVANRYYVLTNTLLTLNGTSGALLDNVSTDASEMQFDSASGILVGLRFVAGTVLLVSVDPHTGASTEIDTVAGLVSVDQGSSSIWS